MTKNIFSFVILTFSVAFLFLYVKPLYDLVEKRRADIELLDTARRQANSVKHVIEETKTILGSISSVERTRFETFLPASLDEIRFVNNIISIARTRSIVLENIKIEGSDTHTSEEEVKKTSASEGIQKIFSLNKGNNSSDIATRAASDSQYVTATAQFSFIAPYATILLFLADMEKSLGLINVNTLTLKEYSGDIGGVKNDTVRYFVTVEIETYSLK